MKKVYNYLILIFGFLLLICPTRIKAIDNFSNDLVNNEVDYTNEQNKSAMFIALAGSAIILVILGLYKKKKIKI